MSIDKELYKPQCLEGQKVCPPRKIVAVFQDIIIFWKLFKIKITLNMKNYLNGLVIIILNFSIYQLLINYCKKRNFGCITLSLEQFLSAGFVGIVGETPIMRLF
ncbi:MAG: hypothetical protein A2355_08425 [Spirochaetes bacterium RIFOXYB1_FULL_32_8]|nr:MAG: hypothetical protein A2355_08425 [Spirochaetes bacterium RIFOXYB1_FULL_32_8]